MAKEEVSKDFRYLVRIANTDLDGNKPIYKALTKIKGISFSYSNAVCQVSKIDKYSKTGMLKDPEIQKLDVTIKNMAEVVPSWLLNRRKDTSDGTDKHLLAGELQFAHENDIRMMKKIRSYKGIRHGLGLPVRGQRTRSNFRRNKGKGPGVIRSKATKAANAEKENKK